MSNPIVFAEEDLSLSANEGSGYFPGRPGLSLKNGGYTIIRKIGFGGYSSTWLVSNSETSRRFHAIKILTADATQRHLQGQLCELEILKAIRDLGDDRDYLPLLHDHFQESGPHGDHLCLVMDVFSTDVSSLRRSAPQKVLPLHMAKIIIAEIVDALVHLHRLHIIHTDLKLDNVLLDACSDKSIECWITKNGPSIVDDEFEFEGQQLPIVRSQPIPHGFRWNESHFISELLNIVLTDFGHAQWATKDPTVEEISHFALRAPEVILRADFDAKVDIWAVGCLTFELITGHWLFEPKGFEGLLRREDDHLAKMMEITGETFDAKLLEQSRHRNHYFDEAGNLLRIPKLYPNPVENALANYKVLTPEQIAPVASFIRTCIRLDPAQRSSAEDLQAHEWLASAFTCSV